MGVRGDPSHVGPQQFIHSLCREACLCVDLQDFVFHSDKNWSKQLLQNLFAEV